MQGRNIPSEGMSCQSVCVLSCLVAGGLVTRFAWAKGGFQFVDPQNAAVLEGHFLRHNMRIGLCVGPEDWQSLKIC